MGEPGELTEPGRPRLPRRRHRVEHHRRALLVVALGSRARPPAPTGGRRRRRAEHVAQGSSTTSTRSSSPRPWRGGCRRRPSTRPSPSCARASVSTSCATTTSRRTFPTSRLSLSTRRCSTTSATVSLWSCFRHLPERCQVLLRALMASDRPNYKAHLGGARDAGGLDRADADALPRGTQDDRPGVRLRPRHGKEGVMSDHDLHVDDEQAPRATAARRRRRRPGPRRRRRAWAEPPSRCGTPTPPSWHW